jgi:hypothetical protein
LADAKRQGSLPCLFFDPGFIIVICYHKPNTNYNEYRKEGGPETPDLGSTYYCSGQRREDIDYY